jgi:pyridoxamine 5'-phosphate oxidase family protein
MSVFTKGELDYLTPMNGGSDRRLGRVATVGKDGTPHVVPSGWSYNADDDTIDIGGYNLEQTKKFRDIARHGRAAIVIDDVLPPWKPRGVEIRGRAEAVGGAAPVIRLHPERIISWGIESDRMGEHHARTVGS